MQLQIAYMVISILVFCHCGTLPMPAHCIETPVGVATIHCNNVCRHAGVPVQVNLNY